jgi:hypothetical protein
MEVTQQAAECLRVRCAATALAMDGIKALMSLSAEIVWETCRPERKIFIKALELGSQGRKDEQQLVQIPLSKPIMVPTHCCVPDDHLRCFEIKFRAVGKWTESTL